MTESPTGQTVMRTISHGHVTRHMLTINQAVHASIYVKSTNTACIHIKHTCILIEEIFGLNYFTSNYVFTKF